MTALPGYTQKITSTLFADGRLELALEEVAIAAPGPDQVVVRIEASPINPSDLMALLISADPAEARFEDGPSPKVTGRVSPETARANAHRFERPLRIGLEGAGIVVAAGENAQHLIGKTVALLSLSEGLFGQYSTVSAAECVPLPEGTTPAEGAAMFVNPLAALTMIEAMRLEGYTGLVHTAAASNLGQMLVKICLEDDIPLVNIVRKQEQVDLLRGIGAHYVCNSSAPTFRDDLKQAIAETGAMVAFDAIGGGTMAGQILAAMEEAAIARMPDSGPYGSFEHKQVYGYGELDTSPTPLNRSQYGMSWSVSGWASSMTRKRLGPEGVMAMRQRILDGLKTTFASRYVRTISLREALRRDVMLAYNKQASGEKYLIDPTL